MSDAPLGKLASSRLSRRQFLRVAGGFGLAAAGLGLLEACGAKPAPPVAAAPALETDTIRLAVAQSICAAPLFVSETFLKAEGLTNVKWVIPAGGSLSVDTLVSGASDITLQFSGPSILYLDAGKPITLLAGVHVGCFELFGSPHITGIGDLKGTTIGVAQLGGPEHVYLASMLANVNIDPTKDVTWATRSLPETKQLFIDGKIDAFLAFPPTSQELHDKQIGHVVVNSMVDKPWSQYFCCMVTASQAFVQKNPVAAKSALRAILKGTDLCALHPEQAARLLVDKGFTPNYQYALETMQEIPYNRWREFSPDDTVRFYSLLLGGVGMVKSTPDEIIKQGTDWTFLNQLKAELPATPAPTRALAATRNLFCTVDGSRVAGAQRNRNAE